jgi:hypothetical protein
MFRHNHRLEILLGDLACRYGVDDPITLDVRAALPKLSEPPSGPSKPSLSGQKPAAVGGSQKGTSTPGKFR